jgi:hypothetical protein
LHRRSGLTFAPGPTQVPYGVSCTLFGGGKATKGRNETWSSPCRNTQLRGSRGRERARSVCGQRSLLLLHARSLTLGNLVWYLHRHGSIRLTPHILPAIHKSPRPEYGGYRGYQHARYWWGSSGFQGEARHLETKRAPRGTGCRYRSASSPCAHHFTIAIDCFIDLSALRRWGECVRRTVQQQDRNLDS